MHSSNCRLKQFNERPTRSRDRDERPVIKKMDIRAQITEQFRQVAREHDKTLAPLTDDLALLDSGLDSLCFAVIVVRLENALGIDPFSANEDVRFPVTFGEFVRFYTDAPQ